jgi:hypothetical protein
MPTFTDPPAKVGIAMCRAFINPGAAARLWAQPS